MKKLNSIFVLLILLVVNLMVAAQNKTVFNYTGGDQFFTVPPGVTTITVKAWGAGGAGGNYIFNDYGGGGGFATSAIPVTPGEVLTVIVGGAGLTGVGAGAYGGGGAKVNGYNSLGGRGGGRSAIRNSANIELITAGGGGGGGGSSNSLFEGAGGGGGLTGGHGNFLLFDGQPGTQTNGGAGGIHTSGCLCGSNPGAQFQGGLADAVDNGYNGSGGGGYYGGGSGTDLGDGGGGGGSSYIPYGGNTYGASNFIPANTFDVDYNSPAGLGGLKGANGNSGLVVISYQGIIYQGGCTWNYTKNDCTDGCKNGSIGLHLPGATGNIVTFTLYVYDYGQGWQIAAQKNLIENNANDGFYPLDQGSYYVHAQSSGGCSENTPVYNIIDASACNLDFNLSSTNSDAICSTGDIHINIIATRQCAIQYNATVNKDIGGTVIHYADYTFQGTSYYITNLASGNYQVILHEVSENGTICNNVTSVLVNSNPCNFDFTLYKNNGILNCSPASIDVVSNYPCATNFATTLALNNNVIQTYPNDASTHHFGGLVPGHYTVSITASGTNGSCTQTKNVDIDPPSLVFFTVSNTISNVTTRGCSNGKVTTTTSNINDNYFLNFWSAPYQNTYNYYLYDNNWNIINNGQGYTGFTFTGLTPGTYYLQTIGTRFDAQSCFVPRTQQIIITEPACFTLTTSATALTHKYCEDGSITATIDTYSNDCSPHIYVFDSLNNMVDEWDPNFDGPCPVTFTDYAAGVYRVEAYAGTCSAINYVTINDGPCDFSQYDFDVEQISGLHGCNGNQLTVDYYGSACGNISFQYVNTSAPNNAGILIYNNNSALYESGANLPPGNYKVIGHNGTCTDTSTFIVTDPPCSLQLTAAGSNTAGCSGNVSGTLSNYCTWVKVVLIKSSNNARLDSTVTTNGLFSFWQLSNGNYKVSATDNTGCNAIANASVSNVLCPVPVNITASKTGATKMTIAWDIVPCAIGYTLQYKKTSAANWSSVTLNGAGTHTKNLTNLMLNTEYQYRVRSKCTSTLYSAYSATQTFCIGCAPRIVANAYEQTSTTELSIYPNPATEIVNLSFEADINTKGEVLIYDQLGKLVISMNQFDIVNDMQLNISNLSNGFYIIAIVADEQRYTARFIVNK